MQGRGRRLHGFNMAPAACGLLSSEGGIVAVSGGMLGCGCSIGGNGQFSVCTGRLRGLRIYHV